MMFDMGRQLALMEAVMEYREEYEAFPEEAETGFYLNNNWFGPVDAEMTYGIVRIHEPSLIVEVGSGMSTILMATAGDRNDRRPGIVAIDPEPRADISGLPGVETVLRKVEDVSIGPFDLLGSDDILFIDSSHIWAEGNDVDVLFHRVLPMLRPGVLVHVHDIFFPNDYPSWWAHRGYNEQTYLFNQVNTTDDWDVMWGSHYMHLNLPDALKLAFPSYNPVADYPGSFWMQKQ